MNRRMVDLILEDVQIHMAENTWEEGEKPDRAWFHLYHLEQDLKSIRRRIEEYESRYLNAPGTSSR